VEGVAYNQATLDHRTYLSDDSLSNALLRNMRTIAIIILLPMLDCFAQLPFRKNIISAQNASPAGLCEASNGDLMVLGFTRTCGGGNNDILLVRTDPNGDTIWTKTYGSDSDEYASRLVNAPDSGYVIAGMVDVWEWDSVAYVIGVDSVGDVIWARAYKSVISIQDMAPSDDGGYVLCGSIGNQPPMFEIGSYLMKIDSEGSLLWSRSFAAFAYSLTLFSVIATDDGGYLLSGLIWHYDEDLVHGTLIRTDADGNLLWTKTFRGSGGACGNALAFEGVVRAIGGGYIVGGACYQSASLMRFDPNGDLIWSKAYHTPSPANSLYDGNKLLQMSNGDIVLCGSSGFIIRTDSIGDVISSSHYDRFYGLTVEKAGDDGILLLGGDGQLQPGGNTLVSSRISMARADATGNIDCVQWNYPVSVTSSVAEPQDELIVPQTPPIIESANSITQGWCAVSMVDCAHVGVPTVHSDVSEIWVNNPVSDQITINGTTNGGRIAILDLSGKELLAADSRTSITTMDVVDLATGIYILCYSYAGQARSFKIAMAQ
jgi:Secretion system C-terminal sorting domain